MIIIKNKYLPIEGFKAMAIYPFIFVRSDCEMKAYNWNHEEIHFAQQRELWIIGFYVLYFIFWARYGYKNIPLEDEAYKKQDDFKYLETRKRYAWLKFF